MGIWYGVPMISLTQYIKTLFKNNHKQIILSMSRIIVEALLKLKFR